MFVNSYQSTTSIVRFIIEKSNLVSMIIESKTFESSELVTFYRIQNRDIVQKFFIPECLLLFNTFLFIFSDVISVSEVVDLYRLSFSRLMIISPCFASYFFIHLHFTQQLCDGKSIRTFSQYT